MQVNNMKQSITLPLLLAATLTVASARAQEAMPGAVSDTETAAETRIEANADPASSTPLLALNPKGDNWNYVPGGSSEVYDARKSEKYVYTPSPKSQPRDSWWRKIRATGSIQTEFLIPYNFKGDKTGEYEKDVLNNTYFDLTINAPYISVGGRFQWTKWPLPGYENDFKGWGVPYVWATATYKWAQVTGGDFYEQFGSGLILRTYQERSLGVDNAIRGGRIKLKPVDGLSITGLGGKQRRYWERNSSWLWGGDAEWSLNETFQNLMGADYGVTIGASYVGKHERPDNVYVQITDENLPWVRPADFTFNPSDVQFGLLNMPRNVAAFDGRVNLRLKDFNVLAEFATKSQDPNADNGYTYRNGSAVLLSATYSKKGFSAYLQAKRSDNMSYRSRRSEVGISSFINHLPAFTMTQTYALAAMYPYATQPDGEWAFQGEVRYLFKKGTPLGGKYGTNVRLSASYISGLDNNIPARDMTPDADGNVPQAPSLDDRLPGTNQFGAPFWKIGGLYYADLNAEINKKLSRKVQLTLFYLFQKYNQAVVEGHGGMVTAHTLILEGQWKMAKKTQLRWEAQWLHTKQDKGDWIAGLVELSFAPHWMVTVTDTWNSGLNNNFYNVMVTYNLKSNRFTLGYGRTREGYNCSGGVCRWVPETKGFSVTYNYTF